MQVKFNVPDLEKRLEAKRLYSEWSAAEDALAEGVSGKPPPDSKHSVAIQEARDAFNARISEINAAYAAEVGVGHAQAKAEATKKAYDEHEAPGVMTDDDGEVMHCSVSGAPLFEDDPLLKDEVTGEIVLKCLLGVPLDDDEGAFVLPEAQAA